MTSPSETTHTNRLANETSPYLLQHARNPVDWYPWGNEAIHRARAEDKPIFLSIGYSACHWCHVMEHESFENEEISAFLNEHFVSVKVDREERPDLDDIYMRATQAMTGAGGWPMSVFLTPALEPFYAGTYFPPTDRYGRPGFASLIAGIARAWQERRDDLAGNGQQVLGYLRENAGAVGEGELSFAAMVKATQTFAQSFDEKWGGFGGAPKFPSGPSIELLLREYVRTESEPLLKMAEHTLHFMHYGGLYDHLGGGFHRYSVDAEWLVPHFEKMLYDNAQLAQAYLEAYQLTGNPLYRRVVEQTLAYVLRDMRDSGGAFHATEDADSEGEEGKFYIWTRSEILEALGEEDGALFCAFYDVRDEGNFSSHEPYHEGQNILHIARPPEATCEEFGLPVEELEQKIDALRAKLLAVRDGRVRPGKDDKILTAWNGLMVSAFARAYQVLGRDEYRRAAEEAAAFVLDTMRQDGVLMRTYRDGRARVPGFLDDYANMALACVDLYEATFDPAWLDRATGLADAMIDRFADSKDGGFFQTVADAPDVIVRMKPTYDGSEPSGNSMAALGLLRLARLTGNETYADHAEKTLRANAAGMTGLPQAFTKMLVALDFHLATPCEVAVAGHAGANDTEALLATLHAAFLPNKVVALVDPDAHNPAELAQRVPVLLDKTMRGGQASAYVCRNYACQEPVTEPEALRAELARR